MAYLEGPLEGVELQPTGGFSYGDRLANRITELADKAAVRADKLSDSVNLFADKHAYQIDKAEDDLSEMVTNVTSRVSEKGEQFIAKAETYIETAIVDTELELGEMKELLADPINQGRLNLYLTLAALETKDFADKLMTLMSTLPPSIQEPVLRFAAENPASLPLSLLAAFSMFFAAKAVHYHDTGKDSIALSTTGEADALSVDNIQSFISLLSVDQDEIERRKN